MSMTGMRRDVQRQRWRERGELPEFCLLPELNAGWWMVPLLIILPSISLYSLLFRRFIVFHRRYILEVLFLSFPYSESISAFTHLLLSRFPHISCCRSHFNLTAPPPSWFLPTFSIHSNPFSFQVHRFLEMTAPKYNSAAKYNYNPANCYKVWIYYNFDDSFL